MLLDPVEKWVYIDIYSVRTQINFVLMEKVKF